MFTILRRHWGGHLLRMLINHICEGLITSLAATLWLYGTVIHHMRHRRCLAITHYPLPSRPLTLCYASGGAWCMVRHVSCLTPGLSRC